MPTWRTLRSAAGRGDISRSQFNDLIAPLVKRTLMACRRALKDAGVEAQEVLEVVMVGGSTRVPLVRERVGEFFWPYPADLYRPGQSRRHWRGDSGGYSGRQQNRTANCCCLMLSRCRLGWKPWAAR